VSTDNGQPDIEPDTTTDDGEEPDTTTEEPDAWTPPDKAAWDKLNEKAKTRDQKLREAQAEIRRLKSPDSADNEPDPVSVANARIIRAEAKSVLAAAGITDRADVSAVLGVLNLSSIEVDDDGEVDSDALEEVVERLRKAFGGAPTRPRPPRLDTRDRGGSRGEPVDPDTARRRRFLTGGR